MYRIVITLILSLSTSVLFAQSYSVVENDSKVIINGTSNVHDWESEAEEFSGTASIEIAEDSLVDISSLEFNVVVDGIKSGKGGMDSKTYDALNEKKHPNITFTLSDITQISSNTLTATGQLTISGVTKDVEMEVEYELQPDGTILFNGIQPIKMTDYNVDPPKAMFGAIKAGEDVEVTFNAKFAQ
ncbi:YceI family protein [Gracilimonas mengyeensis]|uniref:YceI-like domain-containing protein n=1 Tax=Gracilimonas mengyeensis TaxID=1302730 RepID=A0A521EA08_9BACT|nr:YceI family protein [Gracilimonas mengyeensis]SMO80788.1 YceI-like domain-containing protein [Gracilimonas mengyeensis]